MYKIKCFFPKASEHGEKEWQANTMNEACRLIDWIMRHGGTIILGKN